MTRNISHGGTAQLQSSNESDVPFDANAMSHCGSLKNNDVLPLDLENTEVKGYMSPVFKIHFVIICQLNRSFHVIPAFSHLSCLRLLTKLRLIWNTEFMITQGEIIIPTLLFCHVYLCGPVSNRHTVIGSGAGKEIFPIKCTLIVI